MGETERDQINTGDINNTMEKGGWARWAPRAPPQSLSIHTGMGAEADARS